MARTGDEKRDSGAAYEECIAVVDCREAPATRANFKRCPTNAGKDIILCMYYYYYIISATFLEEISSGVLDIHATSARPYKLVNDTRHSADLRASIVRKECLALLKGDCILHCVCGGV